MGKTNKFYVVTIGNKKTMYTTWAECSVATSGVSGATCKGYRTENEAKESMKEREKAGEGTKTRSRGSKEVDRQKILKTDRKIMTTRARGHESAEGQAETDKQNTETQTENQKKEEREEEKCEEEELWLDMVNKMEEEESDINLSPSVVNLDRVYDKVEEKDKCRACKGKVAENALALECWCCKGWYHSHSRCGVELEATHSFIMKMEKEKNIKGKEEEQKYSIEPLEWICKNCRDSNKEEGVKKSTYGTAQGTEVEILRQEIERMIQNVEQMEKENEQMKKINKEDKRRLKERTERLEQSNNENQRLLGEAKKLQSEKKQMQERSQEIEDKMVQMSSEIKVLKQTKCSLETEVKSQEDKLKRLEKEKGLTQKEMPEELLKKYAQEQMTEKQREHLDLIEELQQEIETQKRIYKEELSKRQREMTTQKKEKSNLVITIEELRSQQDQLERKIIQEQENKKELNEKYNEVLQINKELEIQMSVREIEEGMIEQEQDNISRRLSILRNTERERREESPTKRIKDTEKEKEQGKVCISYAKSGRCRYNQCRYEHARLCRNIMEGKECRNRRCRYNHDTSVICRWNRENKCKFGEHCKYVHIRRNKEWKEVKTHRYGENQGKEDRQIEERINKVIEDKMMEKINRIIEQQIHQNFLWKGQDQNFERIKTGTSQ